MEKVTLALATTDEIDRDIATFYRQVMTTLHAAGMPFLVGGAYAFNRYTGINRHTKDLDIFIQRSDYERINDVLARAGFRTELTYPHWLAKVRAERVFIDLIFNSGNGVAAVDQSWFDFAPVADVLDVPSRICPPEEMIWSKAFVMERERYDGADVAHLLRACGPTLDWQRLLQRFDAHWRVLLSHFTLFGFIYPEQRALIPAWLMDTLLDRLRQETHTPPSGGNICCGTLLSREQYLIDIEELGYRDGRLIPFGNMTASDTAHWTNAIPDRPDPHLTE